VLPGENNALVRYGGAVERFILTSAEQDLIRPAIGSVYEVKRTPEDLAELRRIWEAHGALIGLVDELADRPGVATRSMVKASLGSTHVYSRSRALCNLLTVMARVHHEEGKDAEALRDLRRILVVSRLMDCYPTLIGHLVSVATRGLVMPAVEHLEPTLDLRTAEASAEALALARALTDDREMTEGLVRCIEGELPVILEYLPAEYPRHTAWWIRPLYEDGTARLCERYLEVRRLFAEPDWQKADAGLARVARVPSAPMLEAAAHMIEEVGLVSMPKARELHERSRGDAHAAAMLLGARWYAARHGALPREAGALVPEVLGAVPADPFEPRGEAMRYRLDAEGPTVWSVGNNGTDEGGPAPLEE
jgi:hypothetical protein